MVGLMPFPGNKFERKGPVLLAPSIDEEEILPAFRDPR
jgi:hypothetical protein